MRLIIIICATIIFSGCTILSSSEVQVLRNSITILEKRAELNEKATNLMENNPEYNKSSITIINQNTQIAKSTSKTIENIIGRNDKRDETNSE